MKTLMKLIRKKKYLNNSGFSLMELLIALAVMAVVLGASLTTYGIVSRTNTKKAAGYIEDYMSLAREKAKTISTYEWNMTIDATGNSVVVQLVKLEKSATDEIIRTVMNKQTLPANIKVRIEDTNGSVTYLGNGANEVKYASFAFAPLSGSVSRIYFNETSSYAMDLSTSACDIIAYYGDKKSKTVRLYFGTGKHMLV